MKIVKLTERATIPTRGSKEAAGYDLYASLFEPLIVRPSETRLIDTDIIMEIPDGYCGKIYARSGLATKHGLRPANCVGVIDSDYRGSVCVPMHNDSNEDQIIYPGERIAQIIFEKYYPFELELVETLSKTERGTGGFGSTGA